MGEETMKYSRVGRKHDEIIVMTNFGIFQMKLKHFNEWWVMLSVEYGERGVGLQFYAAECYYGTFTENNVKDLENIVSDINHIAAEDKKDSEPIENVEED